MKHLFFSTSSHLQEKEIEFKNFVQLDNVSYIHNRQVLYPCIKSLSVMWRLKKKSFPRKASAKVTEILSMKDSCLIFFKCNQV